MSRRDMDPKPADSFDAFLLTQRQRFRCRLGSGEIRIRDRKADLEQFDIEVRKQPGTMSCIGDPPDQNERDWEVIHVFQR